MLGRKVKRKLLLKRSSFWLFLPFKTDLLPSTSQHCSFGLLFHLKFHEHYSLTELQFLRNHYDDLLWNISVLHGNRTKCIISEKNDRSPGHCAKREKPVSKTYIPCVIPCIQHSQKDRIIELEKKLVFAQE